MIIELPARNSSAVDRMNRLLDRLEDLRAQEKSMAEFATKAERALKNADDMLAAAQDQLNALERQRRKAAEAALLDGDYDGYNATCDAVAKAKRIVEMYYEGIRAIEARVVGVGEDVPF